MHDGREMRPLRRVETNNKRWLEGCQSGQVEAQPRSFEPLGLGDGRQLRHRIARAPRAIKLNTKPLTHLR